MDQEKKIGCTLSGEVERIIQAKALPREVDTFKGLTIQIMDLIHENELESWQAYFLCKLVRTQIGEEPMTTEGNGLSFDGSGLSPLYILHLPKMALFLMCGLICDCIMLLFYQEEHLTKQDFLILSLGLIVGWFVLLIKTIRIYLAEMHGDRERKNKENNENCDEN
jgi:hypothetical protein